MKNPYLIFFTDESDEATEITEGLLREKIDVLTVKSVDEMVQGIEQREVVMIMAYDSIELQAGLSITKTLRLVSMGFSGGIVLIGNPSVNNFEYSPYVGLLIDKRLEVAKKMAQLITFLAC